MNQELRIKGKVGFSLVELLVVISIIAILASIGGVAYANVQSKGRDAKRQADLKMIQSALEHYHADAGYYPSTATYYSASWIQYGGRVYLNSVPKDPQNNSAYGYQALPDGCGNVAGDPDTFCSNYCLSARLELSIPYSYQCTVDLPAGHNIGVKAP